MILKKSFPLFCSEITSHSLLQLLKTTEECVISHSRRKAQMALKSKSYHPTLKQINRTWRSREWIEQLQTFQNTSDHFYGRFPLLPLCASMLLCLEFCRAWEVCGTPTAPKLCVLHSWERVCATTLCLLLLFPEATPLIHSKEGSKREFLMFVISFQMHENHDWMHTAHDFCPLRDIYYLMTHWAGFP